MSNAFRSIPGTAGFQRGDPPWWRRFDASWWHDWSSFLFWRVNWSDFTFIQISGECEWIMSNAEFELALLGFHARFTYYWPSKERDALKTTARLVESGLLETTPLDEVPAHRDEPPSAA